MRSGYSDDCDGWSLIRWRGQVASAIRGKRGQAFLRELAEALDALPEKRLISRELQCEDGVCAIGSVGARRGVQMDDLDPDDAESIAGRFDIAHQLVREIESINDGDFDYYSCSPERRWARVRAWVESKIAEVPA